jgi:hypothetical protein
VSSVPDADVYIAIENGIFLEEGGWLDRAVVCLQTTHEASTLALTAYSEGVPFPGQAVTEAQSRGFDVCTVGKVLVEMGFVEDHADPHLSLCGKSRSTFVCGALVDVLRQFKTSAASSSTLPP